MSTTIPDNNGGSGGDNKRRARTYDRPSALRRYGPRVLVSVVLMIVSLLLSWWLWSTVL